MTYSLVGVENSAAANETWRPNDFTTERTLTETYIIQAPECVGGSWVTETDVADGTRAITPQLSDESTYNPGMFCISRDIALEPNSSTVWRVRCRFSNQPFGLSAPSTGGGQGGSIQIPGVPANPWFEPAKVSLSTESVEVQSLKTPDGDIIKTSAGEVIDGVVTRYPVCNIEITQNELFVNVIQLSLAVGKVMPSTAQTLFAGWAGNEILLDGVSATPLTIGKDQGYSVRYMFKCLDRGTAPANTVDLDGASYTGYVGWQQIGPNYGSFRLPTGGETVWDVTAQREKRRSKWWLNTSGAWAQDDLSDISYLYIPTYKIYDFNNLGLRI